MLVKPTLCEGTEDLLDEPIRQHGPALHFWWSHDCSPAPVPASCAGSPAAAVANEADEGLVPSYKLLQLPNPSTGERKAAPAAPHQQCCIDQMGSMIARKCWHCDLYEKARIASTRMLPYPVSRVLPCTVRNSSTRLKAQRSGCTFNALQD